MEGEFAQLSREPDVTAAGLVAVDAADRLILDEAADTLAAAGDGELAVIGDGYGALTIGAAVRHRLTGIRVHQDALSGERALAANAARAGVEAAYRSGELSAQTLSGARVVLLRLPRALDALDELADVIAREAAPDVRVVAGGMVKHMTPAMNDVLRRHFARVDVTHARQKARVLVATGVLPHPAPPSWPRTRVDEATGLVVVAHGAAFAGATVDGGTRFLLEQLPAARQAVSAIDLGCGTGVIAVWLARERPGIRMLATDSSAAAVASARLTAAANGVAEQVEVLRDDALGAEPVGGSAELIVLNPPFHSGAAVHTAVSYRLFAAAARVLAPGGELWTVWNSPLKHRPHLERIVGPTRQVARNATFTVTVSTRR